MDWNMVFVIGTPIFVIGAAAVLVGRKKGKVGKYIFSTVVGALFMFVMTMLISSFYHIESGGLKQLYIILMSPFEFAIGAYLGGKIYDKMF